MQGQLINSNRVIDLLEKNFGTPLYLHNITVGVGKKHGQVEEVFVYLNHKKKPWNYQEIINLFAKNPNVKVEWVGEVKAL